MYTLLSCNLPVYPMIFCSHAVKLVSWTLKMSDQSSRILYFYLLQFSRASMILLVKINSPGTIHAISGYSSYPLFWNGVDGRYSENSRLYQTRDTRRHISQMSLSDVRKTDVNTEKQIPRAVMFYISTTTTQSNFSTVSELFAHIATFQY